MPTKPILDTTEKGFPAGARAKLIESTEIEVGVMKYPRREVLAGLEGGKTKVQIVLAGCRMYVIGVGGSGDVATGRKAGLFLDSLSITD